MYKDENVLFNNAYNGNPDDIGISKDLLWKWLQRKSTIETDINYPCFMIVQNHRLNLFDSDYLKYVSYNGDHKTLLIFQNDSQLKEVLLIYLIFIQISFHYSFQSLVVIPFIPHIEFMGYKNNKKNRQHSQRLHSLIRIHYLDAIL